MFKFIAKFLFNLLYLVDLAGNFLLLGDPSETISSRLGRAMQSGKPKKFVPFFAKLVDKVFNMLLGDQGHSIMSIEYDEDFSLELWSWIK